MNEAEFQSPTRRREPKFLSVSGYLVHEGVILILHLACLGKSTTQCMRNKQLKALGSVLGQ